MSNSKSVFVDADAFVALNSHKHTAYKKAVKVASTIKENSLTVYTCTYVLLETATILNMYFEKDLGPKIANEIINNPNINVVKGDLFLKKGIELMKKQKSKNVSLNDCVYFAIARNFEIEKVFSFDKHWVKNGFKILM